MLDTIAATWPYIARFPGAHAKHGHHVYYWGASEGDSEKWCGLRGLRAGSEHFVESDLAVLAVGYAADQTGELRIWIFPSSLRAMPRARNNECSARRIPHGTHSE